MGRDVKRPGSRGSIRWWYDRRTGRVRYDERPRDEIVPDLDSLVRRERPNGMVAIEAGRRKGIELRLDMRLGDLGEFGDFMCEELAKKYRTRPSDPRVRDATILDAVRAYEGGADGYQAWEVLRREYLWKVYMQYDTRGHFLRPDEVQPFSLAVNRLAAELVNNLKTDYGVQLCRLRGIGGGRTDEQLAEDLLGHWVSWRHDWFNGENMAAVRLMAMSEFGTLPFAGGYRYGPRSIARGIALSRQQWRPMERKIGKVDLRATYALTQEILAAHGIDSVTLYRSLIVGAGLLKRTRVEKVDVDGVLYERLPDVQILKHPLQSFSVNMGLVHRWGVDFGKTRRIVLQANVPAEAIMCLPCFTANAYEEGEVVVLGVPWNRWSAWLGKAPPREVPQIARGANEQE